MYFETYDYITGDPIAQVAAVDFGDLLQNQHSVKPLVFRAFADSTENISSLKMYLESKGNWADSEFGFYNSQLFVASVESGSDVFSHFTAVPDASSTSPDSSAIGWDTSSSYYVWLDTQITDRTGITSANYRFFYDYT